MTSPIMNNSQVSDPANPATEFPKKYKTKANVPIIPGAPKPGTINSITMPVIPMNSKIVIIIGFVRNCDIFSAPVCSTRKMSSVVYPSQVIASSEVVVI
ncbi:hypothetical protein D3C78_1655080 [compost metagenome]